MAGYANRVDENGYTLSDHFIGDTLAGLESMPGAKLGRSLRNSTVHGMSIGALVGLLIGDAAIGQNSKYIPQAKPGIENLEPITQTAPTVQEAPAYDASQGAWGRGFYEEAAKPTPKPGTQVAANDMPTTTQGNLYGNSYVETPAYNASQAAWGRGFYEEAPALEKPQELNLSKSVISGLKEREGWWDVVGTPWQIMQQLKGNYGALRPGDEAGAITIPGDEAGTGTIPGIDAGTRPFPEDDTAEKDKTTTIPKENTIAKPKEEITEKIDGGEEWEDKNNYPPMITPSTGENKMENTTVAMPEKDENEYNIKYAGLEEWLLQQQERLWAREDAIRKETQEREDTAYQRAVADARKAGFNINLMDIQPAASGGGITSGTALYSGMLENAMTGHSNRFMNSQNIGSQEYIAELNNATKLLEAQINNNFKGNEGDKERFINLIGTIIQGAATIIAFKKGAKTGK